MSAWTSAGEDMRLAVRVTPRARRDAIEGMSVGADGRAHLAVRVTAAPEDGAANEAVRRLVAKALQVRVRDVDIVAGVTSRCKQLRISGRADDIIVRLEAMTRTKA